MSRSLNRPRPGSQQTCSVVVQAVPMGVESTALFLIGGRPSRAGVRSATSVWINPATIGSHTAARIDSTPRVRTRGRLAHPVRIQPASLLVPEADDVVPEHDERVLDGEDPRCGIVTRETTACGPSRRGGQEGGEDQDEGELRDRDTRHVGLLSRRALRGGLLDRLGASPGNTVSIPRCVIIYSRDRQCRS